MVSRLSIYVAAASVLAFAGSWWWLLDLLAHFRFHYSVLLGISCLTLAALRAWRNALVVSLFLIVNTAVVSPLYCRCGLEDEPLAAVDPKSQLVVVQHNMRVINRQIAELAAFLDQTRADLIVLQEVAPESLRALTERLPDYAVLAEEARRDPFGIALLARRDRDDLQVVASVRRSDDYPAPMVEVEASLVLDGRPLRLLGFRAPPPISAEMAHQRDQRIGEIAAWMSSADSPVIVVGDFNATRWSSPMRRLLRDTRLLDGERARGFQPTWPSEFPIRIPIDHALYDRRLTLQERRLGPWLGSDHRPQRLRFAWRPSP